MTAGKFVCAGVRVGCFCMGAGDNTGEALVWLGPGRSGTSLSFARNFLLLTFFNCVFAGIWR